MPAFEAARRPPLAVGGTVVVFKGVDRDRGAAQRKVIVVSAVERALAGNGFTSHDRVRQTVFDVVKANARFRTAIDDADAVGVIVAGVGAAVGSFAAGAIG